MTHNPDDPRDDEPRIDPDDVRSKLADHDEDDEADQNHDALDQNTRVKGKYAYYDGNRPIDHINSHWSIRETWWEQTDETMRIHLTRGSPGWYDASRYYGEHADIKSAEIRPDKPSTTRMVIRQHHHNMMVDPPEPDEASANCYNLIVSQRLGPRIHHSVAWDRVSAPEMDEVIDDYSWVSHGRGDLEQCYVPWTAFDGFDQGAVNERARIVQRVYDLLRDADHPEAVRDEIRRLTDLMDLLDQYAS